VKLSEKIKQVRIDKGFTQTRMAEILGVHLQTLSRYERGELNPSADFLIALAERLGVSERWLLSDKGQMFEVLTFENKIPDDFVTIPLMNGRISAGTGLLAQDGVTDTCMCFRKEWINRKGDPQTMSLIMVSGDSMEPTLSNGDVVLIDHSRNYLHDYGIYAISVDDSVLIKRLQPFGNKVQIISDNSKYPPLVLDAADVVINGKALWYAHDLSD